MSSISLRGVTKHFGDHLAANAIDLTVPEGSLTVLVGPSGCGKTTLLRLIAGLETLDAGRVLIADLDVSQVPAAKRNLAMVFQSYALYPHMTVANNIGFALKLAGMRRTDIHARVHRVAAQLNLTALLDRRPAALSGGQRQRVAIGRAIVREPQAFLFDEPPSNLDATLRAQMRGEIRRLQKQLGVTAVYVTHDQAEAMTLADRIAVLRGGCLEQAGAPLEIYRYPANLFVASFIGSPPMNLLRGVLAAAHGAAIIGIRPEHLILQEGGRWPATVTSIERLGAETYLYATLEEGTTVCARHPGDLLVEAGRRVRFEPVATELSRFDAEGRSLRDTTLTRPREIILCTSTASA